MPLQKEDISEKATHWTEQVQFNDMYVKWKARFIEVMSKYATIWDRHLGRISMTNHGINLNPSDAARIHATPYPTGPRQRYLEKEETEQMPKVGVVELVTTEWASPIVFVPMKTGSAWFCVDHRRLNAVTVRDSYPISRMDELSIPLEMQEYFYA